MTWILLKEEEENALEAEMTRSLSGAKWKKNQILLSYCGWRLS